MKKKWLHFHFRLNLNSTVFLLLAIVILLCALKNVPTDAITSLETIQHDDETPCQTRSRPPRLLTSPEVGRCEFVTHLSRSRACCLWAGSWAGGHWDAGSEAGLGERFPPGHPGWCGPRCFEIWAGLVPGPGSVSGQPALQLQASPSPLTSQDKNTQAKQWGPTAPALHDGEIMMNQVHCFAFFLFHIFVCWTFTCQSLCPVLRCLFCW